MNKLSVIITGILVTIAFSWAGLVLTSHVQLGALEHHVDELSGDSFPPPRAGIARRGKKTYQELGCVACHTQQVRRPRDEETWRLPYGYAGDIERGWGERQSVARDYIRDEVVLLGTRRVGPDLMTVGGREDTREWHHRHLYDPRINTPGSTMPSYSFLYKTRAVDDDPSPRALDLPEGFGAPAGYEVLPTPRADALVQYLLSLRMDYELPEVPAENE